jgi:hypothetical protein
VHFDVYRIETNKSEDFGRPPLYFTFDHRIEASKSYCDVEEAFSDQLGLPKVVGTGS